MKAIGEFWEILGIATFLIVWGGMLAAWLAPRLKSRCEEIFAVAKRSPANAAAMVIAVGIAVAYGGTKPEPEPPGDPDSYSIAFVTGVEGQLMESQSVLTGKVANISLCTAAAPSGKRFAGWKCSNDKRYDDGMLIFNLAGPRESVTMTAIWEDAE